MFIGVSAHETFRPHFPEIGVTLPAANRPGTSFSDMNFCAVKLNFCGNKAQALHLKGIIAV
jgi:hypothetical protein